MSFRPSPAFFVAVLALVLAGAGAGYAAGQITSGQIKDNTVQSQDIKNRTIVGKDVRTGSLPSQVIRKTCRTTELLVAGQCMTRKPVGGTSSFVEALVDCDERVGGRLPTYDEVTLLQDRPRITWANGQLNQYEFISTYATDGGTITPAARDFGGSFFADASAQSFWHRCVRTP